MKRPETLNQELERRYALQIEAITALKASLDLCRKSGISDTLILAHATRILVACEACGAFPCMWQYGKPKCCADCSHQGKGTD